MIMTIKSGEQPVSWPHGETSRAKPSPIHSSPSRWWSSWWWPWRWWWSSWSWSWRWWWSWCKVRLPSNGGLHAFSPLDKSWFQWCNAMVWTVKVSTRVTSEVLKNIFSAQDGDSDSEEAHPQQQNRTRQKKFVKNFKQLPSEEVVLQSESNQHQIKTMGEYFFKGTPARSCPTSCCKATSMSPRTTSPSTPTSLAMSPG